MAHVRKGDASWVRKLRPEHAVQHRADGGATFKQRYPAAAMDALGVPDQGPKMDSSFSNVNDEFPLGNALEAKAKRMRSGS